MGVESDWHLYLIRCRRGSLYAGITTDVERRFAEHVRGGPQAARYLRGKGPLELVYRTTVGTRAQASVLESRVKKLPREQKLRLIAGELTIASLGWAATDPSTQGEDDNEQGR
jgi:putative endonuclease